MASQASLKQLRAKYEQTPLADKPSSITDRGWTIFKAYIYDQRPISQIAEESGLSISRVRQILRSIDRNCSADRSHIAAVTLASPIEQLPLSVRARNSLHKAGCTSIKDVLDLNLAGSIRRMGPSTRFEILAALQHSGFRHPAIDLPPSDIMSLSQSLDRIQARIEDAFRAVSKEVRAIQDRLRKKMQDLP